MYVYHLFAGILGVNGCGKSTLLKVIAGVEDPDTGRINTAKQCRIVYVEQEPVFPTGSTVRSVLYASDSPMLNTLREYQDALDAMTDDPDGAGVAARFERALNSMEQDGEFVMCAVTRPPWTFNAD